MSDRRPIRTLFQEIGTALAALSLWMLLLLAPLHQTSGLLRDLAKTGYDISGAWSICVTLSKSDGDKNQKTSPCPAQAIGKHALGEASPFMALSQVPEAGRDAAFCAKQAPAKPRQGVAFCQPRGPPVPA